MRILLLDVYRDGVNYRISKDTNGSYGTGNDYGDSLFAKFLKRISKRTNFWPPLYLMYTGAVLREQGHSIEYANKDTEYEAYDAIIMSSSIVCHESEIEAIRGMKDKNKVIVIGSFVTNNPKRYIDEGVNVIIGEPEFYFLEKKIEDLIKTKEMKDSVDSHTTNKLDLLPYPCWDLVTDFLAFSGSIKKKKCIPLLAERGCPYSCFNYCTYPLEQGRKPRARTNENIVNEIKFWIDKLGVNEFIFRDPVFSIDRKKTLELAELIIKEELDIRFTIETHLNNLDYELSSKLKEAGMFFIQCGVESVDKDVLNDAKRFSLKKADEVEKIEMLRGLGVKVMGMYILGYESDTRESCLATIEYAKKLNTNIAVFSIFTPYPGTPIFVSFKDRITATKFEEYNQWNPVFKHDNLSKDDIRSLLTFAFDSYYLNIKWFFRNFIQQLI
ncbi:MAG: B12-binding domain-containing radical SAM protein [Thermodesulfobacteriota bacterium]